MSIKLKNGANQGRPFGAVLLRQMSKEDMCALLERLRVFAARKYFGRLDPDALVLDAIVLVLQGKRRAWDKNYPAFENLCLLIRSVASNQLKKELLKKRAIEVAVRDPTIEWVAGIEHISVVSKLKCPVLLASEVSDWFILISSSSSCGNVGKSGCFLA